MLVSAALRRAGTVRLRTDKAVRLEDLMEVFRQWLQARGTRDLQGLLRLTLSCTTWKTAPSAAVLSDLSDLYYLLFSCCPNTAIPRELLKCALEKLHLEAPIKFVGRELGDWCHAMGEVLRMVAADWRSLANGPHASAARQKCFRKVKWICLKTFFVKAYAHSKILSRHRSTLVICRLVFAFLGFFNLD